MSVSSGFSTSRAWRGGTSTPRFEWRKVGHGESRTSAQADACRKKQSSHVTSVRLPIPAPLDQSWPLRTRTDTVGRGPCESTLARRKRLLFADVLNPRFAAHLLPR